MFVQQQADGGIRLVTSASDLTAASICEFAFLRRVEALLGREVRVPPLEDPMLDRAARLGDAHEERVLASYVSQFGGHASGSGGVAQIERADPRDPGELLRAEAETVAALRRGADVVFQATFFDPVQRPAPARTGDAADPAIAFLGYADFIARTPDGLYQVQDTKLARRARVTALMQLAAYAEQLVRLAVPVASEAVLIHGDGARSRHRLADIAPVFRRRRERLHEILLDRVRATGPDGRRESAGAVGWGSPGIAHCGRCEVCEPEVQRTRDPLLIAGIRRTQRDALVAAGCGTIDEVATLAQGTRGFAPDIPGLAPKVRDRLAQQAAVQVREAVGSAPPYEVVDPSALGAIPQPNAGDLFFDFEGDPMYRETGPDEPSAVRWGLDYLFGTVDIHEHFRPFWAHDLEQEKLALQSFLAFVAERRAQYPAMRIYHYAAYERTHLLSIAARHGVGEAEVDQLLREHVLVDLYPIVRKALRVGSSSYSIKKLEPLYMGERLRDEDGVTSGGQSVVEYAEASAQLASTDPETRAEGRRRLDAIADYNAYDCVSTLRLRDWLLSIAAEHGIEPYPPRAAPDEAGFFDLDTTGAALARLASTATNPSDRRAAALAASSIDYHAREQKSFWWAHFARLIDPIEDWADTRDVLVVDAVLSSVQIPWFLPARARNERRRPRLMGEIAPGSSLKVDSEAFLLYEYPPPFPTFGAQPGARGAVRARILERYENGVTVEESRGADIEEYDALPVALAPGPPPPAGRQPGAIKEWGVRLADALERGEQMRDPVYDLLRRLPPRLRGSEALVDPASDEALRAGGGSDEARRIGAVVASLRRAERSTIAVQGPPGTGKTYLAARVIRTLVEEDGWRVGVVAQSHKVVENVLDGVVAAGLPRELVGKVPQGGALDDGAPSPRWRALPKNGQSAFLREHRNAGLGAVLGGTAWDFANETRIGRGELDLLVIDEAGQFSLAPTIAASVSAERLLLLGDPQQLPQVSQGAHPEPVNTAALAWLLGEHETMPGELGYFLAETRRMRPELADIVSELSYEGRLRAHPSASLRDVEGAGPAGLTWHPVEHSGNATSSQEEASEVVRIVARTLENGVLRERAGDSSAVVATRRLAEGDLIVVAAYNAQVECVANALAEAGYGEVRVGTVDKFQGQEALLAIVTLAASSADDVPRGLDFLLMRNRLNVAISRAQWAAHLVSSPQLGDALPTSPEGVAALSGYLRLLERAVRRDGSGRPR